MKKYLPQISVLMLFAFLNLLFGCTYYKIGHLKTLPEARGDTIIKMQDQYKYFIVHQGSTAWHLTDIVFNEEKKELIGKKENLSYDHLYYLTANKQGPTRYKNNSGYPTYEVHIYITRCTEGQNDGVSIPLSAIQKIDTYNKDYLANTTTAVLGILAGGVALAGVILIIVALTKSSCPFVYAYNGQSYQLAGEMYGGAVYSSLERDDYMPLPGLVPENGQYELKISNELKERQYTNVAELMVVNHPDNSSVLIDKNGNVQTITSPQKPISAVSNLSRDYTKALSSRDSSTYIFNDDTENPMEENSLILSFKKPENATSGKLILNAKNSIWLDYINGKFSELFGTYYQHFAKKQKRTPAAKNLKWQLDQGLPLSVYIESEKGWEFVDYFNMVGPLASRDLVMPVNLYNYSGETVKIKLTCGSRFWEVDYAAMDFSNNVPVTVDHLQSASAIDDKGNDVRKLIAAKDRKYLYQPSVGNNAILSFNATPLSGNHIATPFLHTRGYYEAIRNYKNKPDISYLKTF
ncbi:MAG: hypothetical protein Q8908_15670, partial [Bacteroidota bacterium]|nr:hypothetical protein [Bacteroidota bacterium]